MDTERNSFTLLFPLAFDLTFLLNELSLFVTLILLLKNVQLGEEVLSELVQGHAIVRHTVFQGRNSRHVIEDVKHFEAVGGVFFGVAETGHNRRVQNVLFGDVAQTFVVQGVVGVLRASIHILEVNAECLLDSLSEMVSAHVLLVNGFGAFGAGALGLLVSVKLHKELFTAIIRVFGA